MAQNDSELLHHHLKYEMDMLNATFSRIGIIDDPVVANAIIESFCMHARALMEFFEKARGARSYTSGAYEPFSGLDEKRRQTTVRKLNNQIAHLLDGRTADPSEKIGPSDQRYLHVLLTAEYAKFMKCLRLEHAVPAREISVQPFAPSATNENTTPQITLVNTPPLASK